MEGHAKTFVERCCELADKKIEQYKVSAPCIDDQCPAIWMRLTTIQMARDMAEQRRTSGFPQAKSLWSSIGRTVMGKAIRKSSTRTRLGKVPNWECLFVNREKGLFLSVYVDDMKKLAGKKQNIDPLWKVSMKQVDLGEPTSFLDDVYLGCTQGECETNKDIVDNYRNTFENQGFRQELRKKLPSSGRPEASISAWWKVMPDMAEK